MNSACESAPTALAAPAAFRIDHERTPDPVVPASRQEPRAARGADARRCQRARRRVRRLDHGSIPAVERAQGRVATVAVNSFLFKHPVFVGDLVSFYADIVRTGRTSITVEVEVYAQRMRHSNEIVKVTEATLTYVATDEERQPRVLPKV